MGQRWPMLGIIHGPDRSKDHGPDRSQLMVSLYLLFRIVRKGEGNPDFIDWRWWDFTRH
jgi:hypothetical protein